MCTISERKPFGDTSWDESIRISGPAPGIVNGRVVVVDDDRLSRERGVLTNSDRSVIDGRFIDAINLDGVLSLGQRW
jgi:hypothetical protein